MTRLVKDGCMAKVFSVPDIVFWCSKCFNTTKRVIHIVEVGLPPVSLGPLIFQKMLRLPEPNKELKITEENSCIAKNGGLKKIMSHFTNSLSGTKPNIYQYDKDLFKDPY